MSTSKRKTWQEKLKDKPGYPKVLKLEKGFPCYNAVHAMGVEAGESVVLVPSGEVVGTMKKVPMGRLITVVDICKKLAGKHKVKGCCSLLVGIFVMTAANAQEEALREGRDLGIPYWRTLKSNGFLNEKYPGGQEGHRALLEKEGFKVIARGKKYQVENYR
jgi:alkylated DNA nucleotide flippase Atl1